MNLLILGAGGFGREVLDVFRAASSAGGGSTTRSFLGFIDDGSPDVARLDRVGAKLLGGVESLPEYSGCSYVVAVGNPRIRAKLSEAANAAGLIATTLIHPSATWGSDVDIASGTIICAGVRLTTNIRIGHQVHVNLNATIGHDSVLEDFVTVNPQAAISGDVHLEQGVTVGTTASINQGLRVGTRATIGAGAAVIKDVLPGTVVVGVPAKPLP